MYKDMVRTRMCREEMLKKELADMERRNQEAEARHEELAGKLPDTTRPLLRQIEGMQRTAAAQAQAWQAAEHALQTRLSEAESLAASASKHWTGEERVFCVQPCTTMQDHHSNVKTELLCLHGCGLIGQQKTLALLATWLPIHPFTLDLHAYFNLQGKRSG